MDKVFQEEQKNLANIENRIDGIASGYEKNARELSAEIQDFHCYDWDDRDKLMELRGKFRIASDSAKQYRGYQNSPYFGRIDLDNDSETDNEIQTTTYFVGEEPIYDGINQIVVNWESPIADCYYATNQNEFNIKGIKYYLALRRKLEIQKGKLISYQTDYDGESVSLEGDVIDPFLLTVLKDKRRHNRLTDIIKTIQGNQNEIIRKPKSDSFVVQGCAGSGKTMILLHRLSYLKFNNRNMSLNNIKIITPNRYFDAHINDLSIKLKLNEIKRFSVEEYYVYLIKKYSNKITADSSVESEKTLNIDLLTKLYSPEYMEESITHYHEYWDNILTSLNEEKLSALFQQYKINYPDTKAHLSDSATRLEIGINKIKKALDDSETRRTNIFTRLNTIESDINAAKEKYAQLSIDLETIKNQTVSRIELEATSLTDSIKTQSATVEQLKNQKDKLIATSKAAKKDAEYNTIFIQNASSNLESYTDFNQLILLENNISKGIQIALKEAIDEITTAEQIFEKTPLYNFGKRNSLRKQIAEKKSLFSTNATALIQTYINDAQTKIAEFQNTMNTCKAEAEIIEKAYLAERESLQPLKSRHSALIKCLDLFKDSPFPYTRRELPIMAHKHLEDILRLYEDTLNSYDRASKTIETLEKSKNDLESEKVELNKTAFSKEDILYINESKNSIKQLQLGEIFKNVMFKDLFAQYRAYGQKYHKTNFRHKLYLKLLYCSLYFARPISLDSFLNIDEAQDISIVEYNLLRGILGERCIFNLYGDINQSVYSNKGINDWDEISHITNGNVYVLNENYRNTLQITNFCNEEFNAEVYPIGISGAPVIERDAADAIKWIIDIKKENPDHRVAIIHRHGLKEAQEILESLLKDEDISWYVVDDKKISVISVETAKGLEFESVVAIVDQMTNNEKYITYTRALDNLSVVRDKFSNEILVDETDEEFEDEFVAKTEEVIENQDSPQNTFILAVQNTTSDDLKNTDLDQSDISANLAESKTSLDEKDNIETQTDTAENNIQLSNEEAILLAGLESILAEKFDSVPEFTREQQKILLDLYSGSNVAYSAPSGSMKSVILMLLALKERQTSGKQTLLTAEAHLQENELTLVDALGLKGGIIGNSMNEFMQDFKKEKYDIIFVPYDFFDKEENIPLFTEYFTDKIAYWGVDHPLSGKAVYQQLNNANSKIGAIMYLMSKEGFADLDLSGYKLKEVYDEIDSNAIKKLTFFDPDEKLKWILNNLDKLSGQGIIYCNEESVCKVISKQLRKNKIMAEAYIDIDNTDKKERINYLTNSFSNGGIQVLITTHDVGKYLSNPKIRFILHYDMPSDEQLYALHVSQVGQLEETTAVYDLLTM